MKLLILGGTGFFGKSILDRFIKLELKKYNINSVCVFSRNADTFLKKYPEFNNKNIKYIKGDITSIKFLPEADIVIHAATSASQINYLVNPEGEKQNIILGTFNYTQLAKKFHNNAKIVYCSSGAVYGKQPNEKKGINEDFPFQDILELPKEKRDYALGKRDAEKQIKELGKSGLNVAIARCFAFFGDYLPKEGHFAYGNFLNLAEQGKDIEVKATHQVIRSYMHADDLVDSLIQIALTSNPSCPIFNVGSDEETSIFELANQIALKYNVRASKNKNINLKIIDRYVPNTDKLKNLKINFESNN